MTPQQLKASLNVIGWSQAELSRRIDYAPNTISRWMTGEIPIPAWLDAYIEAITAIRDLALRVGVAK
jgi:transcriptional regulator with XRE-family HTH domain